MKKIFVIIGVIAVLGFIFLLKIGMKYNDFKEEYTINLFKLEEISSITIDTLSQYDNKKQFKDEESIKEIYEVFANKKTHIESINDVPVNPDILYSLKFENDVGNSKSAYIYKKGNQYYIEQPYNGIYQITEDEYTKIEKFIKFVI